MAIGLQASSRQSLLRQGEVIAPAEIACTRTARRRGLLGRDTLDGAFVLAARSVHTVGMRFAIDVAFCDDDLVVRRIVTLAPGRATRIHRRGAVAIEARAGQLDRWGVRVGDALGLRAVDGRRLDGRGRGARS